MIGDEDTWKGPMWKGAAASEVFAASFRSEGRERVRLSRHNSATTSKPYPIPNTYEAEEKGKEDARVKFNEIRSGVLNKISGLDSTLSLACPPVRRNERRHKKGGLAQNRVGRIIRANQEIPQSKLKSLLFMTPGMVPEQAPPSSTP